jgi:hypothetical protein
MGSQRGDEGGVSAQQKGMSAGARKGRDVVIYEDMKVSC